MYRYIKQKNLYRTNYYFPECPGWDGGEGGGAILGEDGIPVGISASVGGGGGAGGGGADAAIPVHMFHKHVAEMHMDQVGKY